MVGLFHLSKEERCHARRRTGIYLLIYDMVSQKRRVRLAHLLEGYGVRVQGSCFEMRLSRSQFKRLLEELGGLYERELGDHIIIYKVQEGETVAFQPYQGAGEEEGLLIL